MRSLPPPAHWPRQGLIAVVQAYRWLLKPWLGNACRFEPTCSAYALQALRQHGALRGSALSGWRLMRCHPWCEGGFDPVPPAPSGPPRVDGGPAGLPRSLSSFPPTPVRRDPLP
ncbi:MAG: membrane protein insertion efficiency factor YidD [Rubrivivax sp.]